MNQMILSGYAAMARIAFVKWVITGVNDGVIIYGYQGRHYGYDVTTGNVNPVELGGM